MGILPANQSLNKLAISTDEESRAATSPDPAPTTPMSAIAADASAVWTATLSAVAADASAVWTAISSAVKSIRSYKLRMTTPWRTQNGPANDCRPRPNGSLLRAAESQANASYGAMS